MWWRNLKCFLGFHKLEYYFFGISLCFQSNYCRGRTHRHGLNS